MKTTEEIFNFLNKYNFESMNQYHDESIHFYKHQKQMSLLDIIHYWNMRFTGSARKSVTAATLIYGFLNAQ